MSVNLVAHATSNTANDSGATNQANSYSTMFMKLLATELQSQDPTQTMDPTTMVTQMMQINQLNDVAGIYSILQNQASVSNAGVSGGSHSNSIHSAHNTVGGN